MITYLKGLPRQSFFAFKSLRMACVYHGVYDKMNKITIEGGLP